MNLSAVGDTTASHGGRTVLQESQDSIVSVNVDTTFYGDCDAAYSNHNNYTTHLPSNIGSTLGVVAVGLHSRDQVNGDSTCVTGVKTVINNAEMSTRVNDAEEKRKRAQQYMHIRGAGWKKDWDGKWIRDEDAEFDSDEEPPELP